MSFNVEFMARSRNHALQRLEAYKGELPATVFDFIAIAINNMQAAPNGFQRAVSVKAFGHLCIGEQWSPFSSASIDVKPVDIPD